MKLFRYLMTLVLVIALGTATLQAGPSLDYSHGKGIHHTRIFDGSGKLVADLDAPNLWTTVGKNASLNDALDNGQSVSAESEGNTGGSATVVTITLLQGQNGQTATIVPASLTSLTFASYTGTFKDLVGAGAVTCTGTCTNFTSGTINYATAVVTLNFSSAGPNSNAGTATYNYIVAKWYHHLIISSTNPTDGAMASAASTWQSTHSYAANALIIPTGANNAAGYTYRNTAGACTSGGSTPGTSTQSIGSSTTEGSGTPCVWKNIGLNGFYSATGPFVSGDANATANLARNITVNGAGSAGANLTTTVLTYQDANDVDLAAAASTAVTSATYSYGPQFALADTMASHANWTEMTNTNVTNGTAPQWVPNGASSSASITNSNSTANYTVAASPSPSVIYVWGWATGASNVLPGATGPLFSEAIFSAGAQTVQANYQLQDTYTATQS